MSVAENEIVLPKVIIADDDLSTRMLLKAAIVQWGYEVIEAEDGEQAWEVVRSMQSPPLIILDWLMPKCDGVELSMRIKNDLALDCYIILLTQVNGSTNVVKAFEAGVDEFLTKPFSMAELKIRLTVGQKLLYYKAMLYKQEAIIQTMLSFYPAHENNLQNALLADHFDLNRLKDIYANDDHGIDHFIQSFIQETIKLITECIIAIDECDDDKSKRILHTIKGSSSNCGAHVVHTAVKQCEDAYYQGEFPKCLQLLAEVKRVLVNLNQGNVSSSRHTSDTLDFYKKPILIIDDNLINLKLTQIIVKNNGFEAMTATTSAEALKMIDSFMPSLVLMDLQMPDMDGLEMTRIIKSNPKTRNIIVVALTANAMNGDKERALSSGCDAYITKPFDTKMLPKTITELLEKSR